MDPADVVAASLAGLELGEVVCAPTIEDAERLRAAAESGRTLFSGPRSEVAHVTRATALARSGRELRREQAARSLAGRGPARRPRWGDPGRRRRRARPDHPRRRAAARRGSLRGPGAERLPRGWRPEHR